VPDPHDVCADDGRSDALFHDDDGWFVPHAMTRGPWRVDAMHGGPPGALVGWGIVDALAPGEQVARVTIDLVAPVPIAPLRIVTSRRQISRRVAHLTVDLATDTVTVCSAHVVVLGGDPLPVPAWAPAWDETPPGRELRVDLGPGFHGLAPVFHRDAVEHRVTEGAIDLPGPCVSWVALTCDVIAGRPTPPLCSLLGVADFGSAIAQPLARDGSVSLINVDVSLALSRHPVGEWFRLDSIDLIGDAGVGLAVTQLADVHGPIGVLHQSQLGRRR
jgi:hypothetical protein